VWKVTEKELGFPMPSGYRVLEDVDVVVIVNPIGTQIFVGSATGVTREALRAAIEEDLTRRPRPGADRVPHPDDHPPGAP
jgi:hypothetical protein